MITTASSKPGIDELLSIALPIVQAPMAGVQNADLTAAVSNAGGLGSLPCAMMSPEAVTAELTRLADLTSKPYNVNFFCHEIIAVSTEQEREWRDSLSAYFQELGIDIPQAASGPARVPFGDDALSAIEPFQPAVVSFHFGLPAPKYLAQIKGWGALVLSSATTIAEAQWLASNGADVIIAQGLEAGGHRGSFLTTDMTSQSGTFALTPQVDAAVPVPVIAAGGIADAPAVAAAITLGAAGVQAGTAFLLSEEASTSALHRASIKSEASQQTALTNVFTGRPARSIVNRLVREVGPMAASATAFPTAATLVSALRAAAEPGGSSDFTPLWCGQNPSGCREVPAAEVVRALAAGIVTRPA